MRALVSNHLLWEPAGFQQWRSLGRRSQGALRMKQFTGRAMAMVLAHVFGSVALLTGGCTGDLSPDSADSRDGSLSGELVTYVADFEDHSDTLYRLRQTGGQERSLV